MIQYVSTLFCFSQVEGIISYQDDNSKMLKFNLISIWTGWACAFGISIVGNFQETSVLNVHLAGAMIAFGLGSVYLWTQVNEFY
jgi:hypothetical protein